MKKIVIALASAGLFTAATPGISQAGELEEMRATLQKLQAQLEPMQARITQLEAQKDEPKAPPAAASAVPVRSASAFGGNPNVTLYGKLDVFAEYNSGGGQGDRVALESGGLNGSRLGLKGGADITEGVRGIFQVEAGYFANNGSLAQGGRIFGRQAYAGIEGKYGRLTAGRQYSPLYNTVISFDPYEQGYGSPTTDGNVSTGSTRFDSSIVYASPKINGLSASVMLALGGGTGNTTNNAAALAVNYENGPFGASVAYQNDDHVSASSSVIENAFVGASYQVKNTKLMAGLGRVDTDPDVGNSKTRNEWMIGSQSALTATGQLLLAYAEGRTQDAAPSDKSCVATIGWVETISAQSRIYGIISHHWNDAGAALVPMGTSSANNYVVNPGDSPTGLALGYQYSF